MFNFIYAMSQKLRRELEAQYIGELIFIKLSFHCSVDSTRR